MGEHVAWLASERQKEFMQWPIIAPVGKAYLLWAALLRTKDVEIGFGTREGCTEVGHTKYVNFCIRLALPSMPPNTWLQTYLTTQLRDPFPGPILLLRVLFTQPHQIRCSPSPQNCRSIGRACPSAWPASSCRA